MLKILLVSACLLYIAQSDLIEDAKSSANDAVEKLKGGLDSAGDALSDAAGKAKQAGKDAVNKVGSAAENAEGEARDKLEEIKSKGVMEKGTSLVISATLISILISRIF